MSKAAWSRLDLLREPPTQGSNLSRVRWLLTDILKFTTAANESETMWRGHSSSDYKLCPSLARRTQPPMSQTAVTSATRALLREAKRSSHTWRDGQHFRSLDQLEQLALIQHRITGTPLLDITPDPMIALWMACQEPGKPEDSRDGLLVGLNNWGRKWLDFTGDRVSYSGAITQLRRGNRVGWFRPTAESDRAVVQRSRFLVAPMSSRSSPGWHEGISNVTLPKLPNGWDAKKLSGVFAEKPGRPAHVPLVGFLVPEKLKQPTLDVLRKNFGIERDTVFPDIYALGQ